MNLTLDEKRELFAKPNVTGWGLGLRPKIVDEKRRDELVHRVLVYQKTDDLDSNERIPETINGVKTDVVYVGEFSAVAVNRTGQLRPVSYGGSVGNKLITAGSTGMLYTKTGSAETFMGTNAHVGTPSPFLDTGAILEKRILQPGTYHGGTLKDVCGEYVWHSKLTPYGSSKWNGLNWLGFAIWRLRKISEQLVSRNQVAASKASMVASAAGADKVNSLSSVNLAKALAASDDIDWSCFKKANGATFINATVDNYCRNEPFVGHLFAASDVAGGICKAANIVKRGYTPVVQSATVDELDIVKGSSFWGDCQTDIMDPSVELLTNYGDFYCMLTDIALATNPKDASGNPTIKGGWSGSGFRLVKKV